MDFDVLPPFCKSEPKKSGSSKGSRNGEYDDCYSSTHSFHVELWNYIKQQSYASSKCVGPLPQKSFHVEVPEPNEEVHSIEVALETAFVQLADENGNGANDVSNGFSGLCVRE